jgi:hypothetical protein
MLENWAMRSEDARWTTTVVGTLRRAATGAAKSARFNRQADGTAAQVVGTLSVRAGQIFLPRDLALITLIEGKSAALELPSDA